MYFNISLVKAWKPEPLRSNFSPAWGRSREEQEWKSWTGESLKRRKNGGGGGSGEHSESLTQDFSFAGDNSNILNINNNSTWKFIYNNLKYKQQQPTRARACLHFGRTARARGLKQQQECQHWVTKGLSSWLPKGWSGVRECKVERAEDLQDLHGWRGRGCVPSLWSSLLLCSLRSFPERLPGVSNKHSGHSSNVPFMKPRCRKRSTSCTRGWHCQISATLCWLTTDPKSDECRDYQPYNRTCTLASSFEVVSTLMWRHPKFLTWL